MKLIVKHTVSVQSTPEKIWAKLTNTPTWSMWDTRIQWAELNNGINIDSHGKLKTKGSMPTTFRITAVEPLVSYTSETRVAWLRMIFEHQMQPNGKNVTLTFKISMTGLGSLFFGLIYGKMLRRGLPIWMTNFKRQIESTSRT